MTVVWGGVGMEKSGKPRAAKRELARSRQRSFCVVRIGMVAAAGSFRWMEIRYR
jgi:hypothetical protein